MKNRNIPRITELREDTKLEERTRVYVVGENHEIPSSPGVEQIERLTLGMAKDEEDSLGVILKRIFSAQAGTRFLVFAAADLAPDFADLLAVGQMDVRFVILPDAVTTPAWRMILQTYPTAPLTEVQEYGAQLASTRANASNSNSGVALDEDQIPDALSLDDGESAPDV